MKSTKRVVSISFRNGLRFVDAVPEIFGPLLQEFDFVEDDSPSLCISGPYGAEPPPAGVLHVGYLCENIWPDPDGYDWCFGTWREDVVRHPNYTRITWHGFNPASLVKTPTQVAEWLSRPRRFANFFYSNCVPYRETFCRALASYHTVDCPGVSLRNMQPIDSGHDNPDRWSSKRDFLTGYKFTVAFENSMAPGYHTEKILDPMRSGSIPIYWGDPTIGETFNTKSFINAGEFLTPPSRLLDTLLRRFGRRTHRDYCPGAFSSFPDRVRRKAHWMAIDAADTLLRSKGWSTLVEHIRALDTDDDRYAAMLAEPWFKDNRPPADPMLDQWRRLLATCAR